MNLNAEQQEQQQQKTTNLNLLENKMTFNPMPGNMRGTETNCNRANESNLLFAKQIGK